MTLQSAVQVIVQLPMLVQSAVLAAPMVATQALDELQRTTESAPSVASHELALEQSKLVFAPPSRTQVGVELQTSAQ